MLRCLPPNKNQTKLEEKEKGNTKDNRGVQELFSSCRRLDSYEIRGGNAVKESDCDVADTVLLASELPLCAGRHWSEDGIDLSAEVGTASPPGDQSRGSRTV